VLARNYQYVAHCIGSVALTHPERPEGPGPTTVRQPAARHGANAGIDEEDAMTNDSGSRDLPPAKYCGSFRRGHDVHFIQARLTWELRCDEPHVVRRVTDDGTITFADGTRVWNHDPQRLRLVLARHGNEVLVGAYGVLQVPDDRSA
jgi:hypothetical protein